MARDIRQTGADTHFQISKRPNFRLPQGHIIKREEIKVTAGVPQGLLLEPTL